MGSKADTIADLRRALAALESGGAPCSGVVASPAFPCTESAPERAEGGYGGAEGEERTADAAFRRILRWAAVRERSSAYLRDRLLKDDFAPEAIDEALARAVRAHVVDDRRYGDALIRMKLSAGKGLRSAVAEIEGLGIDSASLDAWQEHAEQGREAEVERALAVLRRRPPRAKAAREAAFRKLIGQGYDTDIAATAARLWVEESLASS